jgi:hypothetical protein
MQRSSRNVALLQASYVPNNSQFLPLRAELKPQTAKAISGTQ